MNDPIHILPEEIPSRIAKIRRVISDDVDDLNLDFVPNSTATDIPVTPVPTPISSVHDPYSFEGEQFEGEMPDPLHDAEPTGIPQQILARTAALEPTHKQLELPLWNPNLTLSDEVPTFPKPQYSFWEGVQKGANRGLNYSLEGHGGYVKSVVTDRAPSVEYEHLPPQGQAAFLATRAGVDLIGSGTRHPLRRIQPEDLVGSYLSRLIKNAGGSRIANIIGPVLATSAMGLGSGIYNPLNLGQGGRPSGYAANSPDPNDPRESTAPIYDLAVEKGFLGHHGKLLPWEQFKQERPDINYQQYSDYQDYLYNKDNNLLRDATLGIVKGDLNGINGPELSIAGYSVTPLGAAAALGTSAAVLEGIKHFAVLRR